MLLLIYPPLFIHQSLCLLCIVGRQFSPLHSWTFHLISGFPVLPCFTSYSLSLNLYLRILFLLILNSFAVLCKYIQACPTHLKNCFESICYFESAFAFMELLSFPLESKFLENLPNPEFTGPTISVFLPHGFISTRSH